MVERFGWSLREIDETDMESLLSFLMFYPEWKTSKDGKQPGLGKASPDFCDEVEWL